MRKVTMVRLGIAAAITALGSLGALASGCTSDDSSNNNPGDSGVNNNPDSGNPGDDTNPDGATNPDGGTPPPPDSGPPDVFANLIIVHAAPGLGPVRLCFGITTNGTTNTGPTFALPDSHGSAPPYATPPAFGLAYDGGVGAVAPGTPGVYPGTIGALPSITSLKADGIVPYIIDANLLVNETADGGLDGGKELECNSIVGLHGLGDTDTPPGILTKAQFTTLPTIPAGTFLDNKAYLLALTGCTAGFAPSAGATELGLTAADICGSDYTAATGNVAVSVTAVDNTTAVADGGWGVQFAQRSVTIQGTPFPIIEGDQPTGLVHAPASAGLVPGFLITQLVDAGPVVDAATDDAGDAGDAATAPVDAGPPATQQSFAPVAAGPVATGAGDAGANITPLTTVNYDPTTSAFGFLTAPGSLDGGAFAVSQYPASAAGLGDLFVLPLGATGIQGLSNWGASTAVAPTTYAPGTSFTFVVVGSNDLTVPQLVNAEGQPNVGGTGTYDGRGLHIVAFPNNFTATKLTQ